ncbi:MAG: S8 family serine peptidase, partial [Eubacteriales bacterium]|nr:S8 family serine peptidase [Eubacteriales bacterium]
ASLYINLGEPVPYTLEQGVFFEIIANRNRISEGIWKIVILGQNIIEGRFDIWLPVTEVSSRNTKFLKPSSSTTLTIPATASNVISVGGYNSLTNSIADFSGRGFTRNNQLKPDIVAPAVNITTASNFLGYDTLSGTSFATPFVTGACALLMEWGIVNFNDLFLYGERLKAFLRLGARRNQNLVYTIEECVVGSLCVSETLRFLELYKEPISINSVEKIVKKMEIGNIENREDEDVFYSDDYAAFLAEFNSTTINAIQDYDYIKMCRLISGGFVVLYIEKDKINLTSEQSYRMVLQVPSLLGLMDKSALEASGVLAVQNQPFLNLKGSGVLIGIIDTGVNYTIDELIYEDNTTKIVSIWDQTIRGNTPENQCFGTEYTREMINEALASENPFEIVPSNDEIGHGTRLASICAGRESTDKDFIGVAPDSELIVVKLKQANKSLRDFYFVSEDVVCYDSADLLLGMEYLYEKARELNKPIAICVGMGTNYGAHNGFSISEQALSKIGKSNGVGLCICNGNEGNKELHASLKLTEVEVEKTFEIKVGENEQGFMLTIVSFPSDRIGINIISPNGRSTGRIPPRNNYDEEIFFPLNNTRVRIQYLLNSYQSSGELVLITFKTPSEGIWKVNVYAETLLIGDVHAWLPISNFISSETYFLNSNPYYTVTIPATSNSVIAVGGYNSLNNSFYPPSGRGPTSLQSLKPVICAPSANVSCIGNTGQLEIASGTSIGTAIAAGCSALLLEWGIARGNDPIMNSTTILGNLAIGAKKVPNESLPNNNWGFGILDILGTFEKL